MAGILCEAKACVNTKDCIGRTPIHLAAQYNTPHAIELLLKHGADINSKDNDGNTPLHYGNIFSF